MPFDITQWKEFKIGELFDISRGCRLVKDEDYFDKKDEQYRFPVITAKTTNNGVDGFYFESNCDGNCVVACGEASGMFSTYQREPCWVMDTARIFSFKNKDMNFTPAIGLFFVTILNCNTYRFSYGRKAKPSNMYPIIIKLPVKKDINGKDLYDKTFKFSQKGYVPDFQYMEDFIKNLHQSYNQHNDLNGVKITFEWF